MPRRRPDNNLFFTKDKPIVRFWDCRAQTGHSRVLLVWPFTFPGVPHLVQVRVEIKKSPIHLCPDCFPTCTPVLFLLRPVKATALTGRIQTPPLHLDYHLENGQTTKFFYPPQHQHIQRFHKDELKIQSPDDTDIDVARHYVEFS